MVQVRSVAPIHVNMEDGGNILRDCLVGNHHDFPAIATLGTAGKGEGINKGDHGGEVRGEV